ncbi:MAG: hypothetical protein CHKLHMKO_00451 [Candidatus Argoarchaeum ethanivorans]|uniref:Uncharacterized protein n=1 Tax=Candidatus Argoarchaeum ethanivorans TaxID=2608793 RepID=A0A811TC27_9EURY|nr:MAG: hypothetical protein CHKLHMKO_00451 [Candidatus Argoarchaeum ethanivorans]
MSRRRYETRSGRWYELTKLTKNCEDLAKHLESVSQFKIIEKEAKRPILKIRLHKRLCKKMTNLFHQDLKRKEYNDAIDEIRRLLVDIAVGTYRFKNELLCEEIDTRVMKKTDTLVKNAQDKIKAIEFLFNSGYVVSDMQSNDLMTDLTKKLKYLTIIIIILTIIISVIDIFTDVWY